MTDFRKNSPQNISEHCIFTIQDHFHYDDLAIEIEKYVLYCVLVAMISCAQKGVHLVYLWHHLTPKYKLRGEFFEHNI